MLPVESQFFRAHVVELFVDDRRSDDEEDGKGELDDDEDFSEQGTAPSWRMGASQRFDRLEGREENGRVTSRDDARQ